MGYYVFEYFDKKIPVIGVAKSYFFDNEKLVCSVLRGYSQKPLYVTAIGLELATATQFIIEMDGEFRMPTLLKLLDTQTKEGV